MSIFSRAKEVKKDLKEKKEDWDERRALARDVEILDTAVKLDMLKEKYKRLLSVQRQILRGTPTKSERAKAEAKIRSGICAYTIVCEAKRQLEDIKDGQTMNQMLSELNSSLRAINRLAGGSSERMKKSVDKKIEKLAARDSLTAPEDLFSDAALAKVDEWLGERFTDVANRFVRGESVDSCMRASQFIMEENPMPYAHMIGEEARKNPEQEVSSADLDDLMNSSLFG
ncbi:MAG: hypothetical protein ACSW75_00500 [Lachnospiraceae bacterium]